MMNSDAFSRNPGNSGARRAAAPVIDQDGREINPDVLRKVSAGRERLDFQSFGFRTSSANPFAHLTREQRLERLELVAKLLDVAFILPGTNIRYGLDGLI